MLLSILVAVSCLLDITDGYKKVTNLTYPLFVACSTHAEVETYFRIPPRKRNDVILIVIRVRNNGNISCSKPCENCAKFIEKKKIKVFYSTDEGDLEKF